MQVTNVLRVEKHQAVKNAESLYNNCTVPHDVLAATHVPYKCFFLLLCVQSAVCKHTALCHFPINRRQLTLCRKVVHLDWLNFKHTVLGC